MDSEIEFDLLVETIFSTDLRPALYYNVQFSELDIADLFELLLMVFTNGAKILYGDENDQVSLDKWGVAEITEMNQRFHSFGFKCNIGVYNSVDEYSISGIRTYREIQIMPNTRLNELYFSIKCNSKNGARIYVVNFETYNNL